MHGSYAFELSIMSPTLLLEWSSSQQDLFLKPSSYITHNVSGPMSDITGGSLSDDMLLLLEPEKALYFFFHIYSSTPCKRRVNTL